jgi:hypothetical protein
MNTSSIGRRWFQSSVRHSAGLSSIGRQLLIFITLGAALTACVSRPDKAYFEKPGSWDVPYKIHCPARDVIRKIDCPHGCPRNPKTKFLVVEFDDHGVPRKAEQLSDALKAIEDFSPENVLVYVHGWHNDSSPDRGQAKEKDMNDLDGLVHRLVEDGKTGKTLAIYIGWRGEIWKGFPAWFSLPNRRAAAGKIGSSSELSCFLGKVASAGKSVDAKVIFTGHSLGAALLEKAAANMIDPPQKLVDQQQLPHLFLLANSAEVANTSSVQVQRINKANLAVMQGKGTKLLSPLVLAVTSKEDFDDRWWNFWFNYFFQQKLQNTLGFEPRLQTHQAHASDEHIHVNRVPTEELRFRLAREARIDPSFWVPDAAETKFTLHRMHPIPVLERKSMFSRWLTRSTSFLIPGFDPPVEISETNNELFWNVLIPGELCAEHNDVYNNRIIGATISWLGMAQPQLLSKKVLPHDLPELLNALRSSIMNSASGGTQHQDEPDKVRQYVMAAATRMPRNEKCIKMLLLQLASPAQASSMSDSAEFRFRANLFYILKFTVHERMTNETSRKFGWTDDNTQKLIDLMQRPEMWKALAKAGDVENSPETDKNLNAFYAFLRQHGMTPP